MRYLDELAAVESQERHDRRIARLRRQARFPRRHSRRTNSLTGRAQKWQCIVEVPLAARARLVAGLGDIGGFASRIMALRPITSGNGCLCIRETWSARISHSSLRRMTLCGSSGKVRT